ncbi:MAG: hypothetical protein AAFX02_00525 [Pseudomonadota bacterium]
MSELKIGYLVNYYTGDDPKWREDDFRACAVVKGMKQESFNFSASFNIEGTKTQVSEENVYRLVRESLRRLARATAKLDLPEQFAVVPIPNSSMCLESEERHRIQALASEFGLSLPEGTEVLSLLKWIKPKEKSHRSKQHRNSEKLESNLALAEKTDLPILLFDDVRTSGASMMAATRFLRKEGLEVFGGVTMARASKIQHEKSYGWVLETLDCRPESVQALDGFFAIEPKEF